MGDAKSAGGDGTAETINEVDETAKTRSNDRQRWRNLGALTTGNGKRERECKNQIVTSSLPLADLQGATGLCSTSVGCP